MNRRARLAQKEGIVLVYLAGLMFVLLAFAGLTIDLGRAYLVKAHLSKAVDGAALAGARVIGEGQSAARAEANKIFNVNFPSGYLGVSSLQNPPTVDFAVAPDGSNIINVSSTAVLPTTFMKVSGFNEMNVASSAQATKRLVDLALVLDRSGSLGSVWGQVQSAAQQFVTYFDENGDRVSLVMFSSNTIVMDPIRTSGRGFDKSTINSHIAGISNGGNTSTAEGLYQGWDQLRTVPASNQSGLRIIVLFTDGSPNTFSGRFDLYDGAYTQPSPSGSLEGNYAGALLTNDFPSVNGNATNTPTVRGLVETYGTVSDPAQQFVPPTQASSSNPTRYYSSIAGGTPYTQVNSKIPFLPNRPADLSASGIPKSYHAQHSSSGILDGFPLYDASLPGQRSLDRVGITYPNHVKNANNAARNLLEVIANAARSDDSGAHRIRIYTLGLGDILNENMGAVPETGSSILERVANDPASPGYNPNQPAGKYYFAGDPAQLNAAFESVRNQILRLSE